MFEGKCPFIVENGFGVAERIDKKTQETITRLQMRN